MASTNTRFSIAVHLIAAIADREEIVTSEVLAESVNANNAFVKRILAMLSKASLIKCSSGKSGGCQLGKSADGITLLDVYSAVNAPPAFAIHGYPAVKGCRVSSKIKEIMGCVLAGAQDSFERDLGKTTVYDVVKKIRGA